MTLNTQNSSEPTAQDRISVTIAATLNTCADMLGPTADEYAPPSLPALERARELCRIARQGGDSKVADLLQRLIRAMTYRTVLEAERCTIYVRGLMGMGISKYELRSIKAERGPYAQHADALHVEFVLKGRRLASTYAESRPYVLVLAGWGHPDPDGMWLESTDGVTQHGRYSGCDPRWETDFDSKIAGYLAAGKAEVLLDARGAL